jgi:hypothetical protein
MGYRNFRLCGERFNPHFTGYRSYFNYPGIPAKGYTSSLIFDITRSVGPGYFTDIMLNNPFFIEIKHVYGRFSPIEVIPIYQENNGQFIASGNFRLYTGYHPDDGIYGNAEVLREQYFDNVELMGDDNPCFLGELHFPGFALFEWRYTGSRLTGTEIWQIVDLLQNSRDTTVPLLRNY